MSRRRITAMNGFGLNYHVVLNFRLALSENVVMHQVNF